MNSERGQELQDSFTTKLAVLTYWVDDIEVDIYARGDKYVMSFNGQGHFPVTDIKAHLRLLADMIND